MPKEKKKIKCKICGEEMKHITSSHLASKHEGMTTDEYRALYPKAFKSKKRKRITDPLERRLANPGRKMSILELQELYQNR